MGQAATKERQGSEEASGSSSHRRATSYPSQIDGGALVPQGVYQGEQDYDHDVVKTAIVQRRLMPFYKGADDESTYQERSTNTECPICFLYYPSPLNMTRCCAQPICSECFVQMKRPDPNHTSPPSTHPVECPYCTAENFGVVYSKPSVSPTLESGPSESPVPDRPAASQGKRKSFSHTDREVLTIDMVRPDWSAKLAAAQQAVLRRANRRIIMRQVGNRLIPIGISSSRAGAELPVGSGPGGAIVLREGERWGQFSGDDNGRRRSRRGASGLMDLGMAGQDIEELMIEEAMRLSLLEHEEQQRRQNGNTTSTSAAVPPAEAAAPTGTSPQPAPSVTSSSLGRSSSTTRGQPMPPSTRRADRISQDLRSDGGSAAPSQVANTSAGAPSSSTASQSVDQAAPASTSAHAEPNSGASKQLPSVASHSARSPMPPPAAPINLGLQDDMFSDLAELVDQPNDEMKQRLESARRSREAQAAAAEAASRSQISSQQQQHQRTGSASSSGPTGRALNPNNPFRSRVASGEATLAGNPPSAS